MTPRTHSGRPGSRGGAAPLVCAATVVLAALFAASPAVSAEAPAGAESLLARAERALDDGDADRAEALFEEALSVSKKEQLQYSRKFEKLNTNLGGIRKMKGVPDAVFIVDTAEEETAVREANKLGIPVIGIVDTNCDPTLVTFPIPGNDDAIRAITLFTRVVAESIEEGRNTKAEGQDQGVDIAAAKDEPKAASATLAGDDSKVEAADVTPPSTEKSEKAEATEVTEATEPAKKSEAVEAAEGSGQSTKQD